LINLKVEKSSADFQKSIHHKREYPDKKGIGYGSNQKDHKTSVDSFEFQDKYISTTSSRRNQKTRCEKDLNGYYFSCNKFGHKSLDFKTYGRREYEKANNIMICWKCNHVGHIARFFYTIRCYRCNTFGHEVQSCRKSISLLTKENAPYKAQIMSNQV